MLNMCSLITSSSATIRCWLKMLQCERYIYFLVCVQEIVEASDVFNI